MLPNYLRNNRLERNYREGKSKKYCKKKAENSDADSVKNKKLDADSKRWCLLFNTAWEEPYK